MNVLLEEFNKKNELNEPNESDGAKNTTITSSTVGREENTSGGCNDATTTSNANDNIDIDDNINGVKIRDMQFLVQASNSQTVGKKRKQAKKMKSGNATFSFHNNGSIPGAGGNNNNNHNHNDGMVKPNDLLAQIKLTNGITVNVPSCVCGTLLEVNDNLKQNENLSLLVDDPLLDGYIAVILPNGSFPPS